MSLFYLLLAKAKTAGHGDLLTKGWVLDRWKCWDTQHKTISSSEEAGIFDITYGQHFIIKSQNREPLIWCFWVTWKSLFTLSSSFLSSETSSDSLPHASPFYTVFYHVAPSHLTVCHCFFLPLTDQGEGRDSIIHLCINLEPHLAYSRCSTYES